MISYLGSLVQFSPATGRAGRCRQTSLCVDSIRCVPARQPEVLAASPQVRRTFSLRGERLRQPEVCAASPRARCTFSLHCERLGQPEAWRPLHGRTASFPSVVPVRPAGQVSESLQIGTGSLFALWEGVAPLGLSLPLSPPPCLLPPAGMGRLFSAVSLSLCFANHRQCVPAG